jgi:hypothetical protein
MTLARRLSAYLVGLHVLLFVFTLVLLRDQPALFIGVEVLLLVSLGGGFALVRRAMQPLEYTERFRGHAERRAGVRLRRRHQPDERECAGAAGA